MNGPLLGYISQSIEYIHQGSIIRKGVFTELDEHNLVFILYSIDFRSVPSINTDSTILKHKRIFYELKIGYIIETYKYICLNTNFLTSYFISIYVIILWFLFVTLFQSEKNYSVF